MVKKMGVARAGRRSDPQDIDQMELAHWCPNHMRSETRPGPLDSDLDSGQELVEFKRSIF